MKINIDTKKGAEAVSNFLQKTSDFGKKTLSDVHSSAIAFSEKAKQDGYQRRLRKYKPLFPEVYFSSEFTLPNMIMIRDDAERRGIDVCEGAIGWLGTEGGMEVLYLYDESISGSGISFIPAPTCDAIYYVDSFDRRKYIRLDCLFSKSHEERLAELKYIAHSLGAKSCSIEISESTSEVTRTKQAIEMNAKASANTDFSPKQTLDIQKTSNDCFHYDTSVDRNSERSGKVSVQFEGSSTPKKPKLKWFAHDDNIKRLIEMRTKGDNSILSETLRISGSSSATMSKATACSIDHALSMMGIIEKQSKGHATMEMQVIKENRSTLIFNIEF